MWCNALSPPHTVKCGVRLLRISSPGWCGSSHSRYLPQHEGPSAAPSPPLGHTPHSPWTEHGPIRRSARKPRPHTPAAELSFLRHQGVIHNQNEREELTLSWKGRPFLGFPGKTGTHKLTLVHADNSHQNQWHLWNWVTISKMKHSVLQAK